MFDKLPPIDTLLSLDEFITPNLLRPFYLVAMAVTALAGLFGVLGALGTLFGGAPLTGLIMLAISLGTTLVALFAIRLGFEAFIALFRLHSRFVGGHPRDEIPD